METNALVDYLRRLVDAGYLPIENDQLICDSTAASLILSHLDRQCETLDAKWSLLMETALGFSDEELELVIIDAVCGRTSLHTIALSQIKRIVREHSSEVIQQARKLTAGGINHGG